MKVALKILGLLFLLSLFIELSNPPVDVEGTEEVKSTKKDSVKDAAYRLCYMMEQTGLATECDVNAFNKSVDIRIDMTTFEARKTCVGIAAIHSESTGGFKYKGWSLRIFSPFSGKHPITKCVLY